MKYTFDWQEYASIARQMAAEGCVLLRNEDHALPILKNDTVSVFGRIQLDYYKSGTGSGGMVNAPYTVGIVDGLQNAGVRLNEQLLEKYREFVKTHPFDRGIGWGNEPFSQKEMPLTEEEIRDAAAHSDIALLVIGRSAGEDRDAVPEPGSYRLSEEEYRLLRLVCRCFRRTAVLLNTGSIMDMSWVEDCFPQAVLYVWQGGQEGGNGIADILTGKVCPSGHLADTIARKIEDYPSTSRFGDRKTNLYKEDIYVGYRYFESAAKDKVLYPFGFGLSYTAFERKITDFTATGKEVRVSVEVMNTGDCSGREVIQIYYEPPLSALACPARNLIRFGKTRLLAPGEKQTMTFLFSIEEMASYDDVGKTGNRSCFVLAPGVYTVYAGTDVRQAQPAGTYEQPEWKVTRSLEEACAPVREFERMRIVPEDDEMKSGKTGSRGSMKITWETVPVRTADLPSRISGQKPADVPCRGDQGIRLIDVKEEKAEMEDFLSQLSDDDLIEMTRGEGMCSPKVTPGVAGAFGGITDSLKNFGIPAAACSDGPSGVRMDNGTMAFSGPCGTLIACSFNTMLAAQLYDYIGRELRKNRIDSLLGPGINIHRNPLNGRNFEYFSEDPYLTGTMAAAELLAMHRYGVSSTIKHFACNNQETGRRTADSAVSERALREIYLKPFETAVRNGGAMCVMSSYGALNGTWTAGNYDLLTTVLRREWKYQGLVMTDWWAEISDDCGTPDRKNTTAMVRAQNDLYMVCGSAHDNSSLDNTKEGLSKGIISRGELVRNAGNILRTIMQMPCMEFFCGRSDVIDERNRPEQKAGQDYIQPGADLRAGGSVSLDVSGLHTGAGCANAYSVKIHEDGDFRAVLEYSSELGELAQMSVTLFQNNTIKDSITLNGTNGEIKKAFLKFDVYRNIDNYLKFYFSQDGLKIKSIVVYKM
jgi:beta-glucosidase